MKDTSYKDSKALKMMAAFGLMVSNISWLMPPFSLRSLPKSKFSYSCCTLEITLIDFWMVAWWSNTFRVKVVIAIPPSTCLRLLNSSFPSQLRNSSGTDCVKMAATRRSRCTFSGGSFIIVRSTNSLCNYLFRFWSSSVLVLPLVGKTLRSFWL